MPLLIALLALQAATSPAGQLPPGTFLYAAPTRATDYEAVVRYNVGYGPEADRERTGTLLRSGSLLREESAGPQGASVVVSDFADASSVSYGRDTAGRFTRLSIGRARSDSNWNRHRREATGRRERALGEECQVWRVVRLAETGSGWPETMSCDTADGIQLWTRTSARDTILNEARLLSLRRRPVRHEEIAPPADLLRWAYWRDLPSPAGRPARAPVNFSINLSSLGRNSAQTERIMRRRDDWGYTAWTAYRNGYVYIDNRAIQLAYETEADGRPISLTINMLSAADVRMRDRTGFSAIAGRPPEQVLGETCRWSIPSGDGAVVVTSGDHRDCVTEDGLTLASFAAHRVVAANLTATSVSRRRPPLAAMMPPAEAFDWARWGIRPAP